MAEAILSQSDVLGLERCAPGCWGLHICRCGDPVQVDPAEKPCKQKAAAIAAAFFRLAPTAQMYYNKKD